jgi:hypothetical protein
VQRVELVRHPLVYLAGAAALLLGCPNAIPYEGRSTTGSGGGASTSTASGSGGASTSGTTSGAGGGGGSAPAGKGATELVSSGTVAKSASYRLVFTLGQPTQNQGKMTSANHRLQGGLVGATETLP